MPKLFKDLNSLKTIEYPNTNSLKKVPMALLCLHCHCRPVVGLQSQCQSWCRYQRGRTIQSHRECHRYPGPTPDLHWAKEGDHVHSLVGIRGGDCQCSHWEHHCCQRQCRHCRQQRCRCWGCWQRKGKCLCLSVQPPICLVFPSYCLSISCISGSSSWLHLLYHSHLHLTSHLLFASEAPPLLNF